MSPQFHPISTHDSGIEFSPTDICPVNFGLQMTPKIQRQQHQLLLGRILEVMGTVGVRICVLRKKKIKNQ